MAITTSLNAGQRTVTLTYTAENTKVLSLMTDAAKWNYDVKKKFQVYSAALERNKVWDELTTLEKLNILDFSVREQLISWARQYYFTQNITAAQEAVTTAGEAAYEL